MQTAGASSAGGTVLIISDAIKLFLFVWICFLWVILPAQIWGGSVILPSGQRSLVDYLFSFFWDECFHPGADLLLVALATWANTRFCPLFGCEMVDVCRFGQLLSRCVSQRAPQTSIGHSSQLSHIPPTPLPKHWAVTPTLSTHGLGVGYFDFPDCGSISRASRQQEVCVRICKIPN